MTERTVLVAGGGGFIGSHLCDALLERGDGVVCVDNLITGRRRNISHLEERTGFCFVECDVMALSVDVLAAAGIDASTLDVIVNLASPASPRDYLALPLETLRVGSAGTTALLELALAASARFVLGSTSEVYGSPHQHPQVETYWGNVNPIGERSVYDEAKRFAEAVTSAHRRHLGVETAIVRIFNTYGPRMKLDDGRVVTNFVGQALRGEPLTVYGDGSQTRSLCYVDDLVRGLIATVDTAGDGPYNLGNPIELTMVELAELVLELTGTHSELTHLPLPADDPHRRRPDITRAHDELGWVPKVGLREGLTTTIESLRHDLSN
ncbi:MAG: GDP-mannose 4,6-dehydratase [Actinomycetota bacterium]|nr:GDP-mannose 4,6-dehydratase [Actinomycetota bacterium]